MFFSRATRTHSNYALAAFAAAIFAGLPASAAVYNWDNLTGNWNTGTNWTPDAVPLSDAATELNFGGSATPYTATNNLGTPFLVNIVRLQSNVAGVTQTLNADITSTLDFTANGAVNPTLLQSGSGPFNIDIPINLNSPLTMQGTGTGLVTFLGAINGFSDLAFTGGSWMLRDVLSSFGGIPTIGAGAFVELKDEAVGNTNLLFAGGGSGIFGSGTNVTFNGGTLKLSTQGTGNVQLGTNRVITGGVNGGTLDITNTNPGSTGGNIGGGDLAIATTDGATAPLVIKFNGGEGGVSNTAALNGDWQTGSNALRTRAITGTGPVRIELTNGGMYRAGTGAGGTVTIPMPTTMRGVVGGDPTSGPSATNASSISKTTGRMALDNMSVLNYSQGLTFEGAMQVALTGGTRAFDGNLTIAGSAGGNAGYVTFSGRSTGTSIASGADGSVINTPGQNTAGQNVIWIGQGRNDLLTIQDGGIAVMDLRVRSDQGNHNGVLLDANTQVDAGGTLRFAQSLSNSNSSQGGVAGPNTTANVGNHIVRGDLRGSGTTTKESVIELYLPVGNVIPATISTPLSLGGVNFDTTAGSSANLVVNGTGFGGLKVVSMARPAALLGGAADPVANSTKLNNLLTVARVTAVTGTGGYLTPAATGETYIFPNAEWAAGVPVGLRVANSNANGADVQFSAATWGHNLAVDANAELTVGASPFTLSGGTLNGTGTLSGTGGITIAAPATVSPGFAGIGTLSLGAVTLGGTFLANFANTSADQLAVSGNLTLSPTSILQIAAGSTFAGSYTLATYTGSLTGTFGTVTGLPVGYTVNYATPGQVRMVLSSVQTLTWNGTPAGTWSTSGTDANWQGGATFNDADVVNFTDSATGTTTVAVSGTVQPGQINFTNATKNYVISGTGSITGPAVVAKSGNGTVTINGSHNWGGGTIISGGSIILGNNEVLPNAGAVTVGAGATLNVNGKTDTIGALTVTGTVTAGDLTVNSLTLQDGAVIQSNLKLNGNVAKNGTAPVTVPGTIDLNGSRIFNVSAGTGTDLTITGKISNGALQKDGSGLLALNAVNTYVDGTTVNNGTLQSGVAGGIPSGAITVNGGTLNLNAFNLTATALSGVGGAVALGGATLTINSTTPTTFAGNITGTGSVVKSGAGVQTLGGASTFDGGLVINAGRVNITSTGAVGTGAVDVNAGAGLQFGAAILNNVNVNGGTISGAGGGNLGVGNLKITGASNVFLFNRDTNANSDMISTGTLTGNGTLTITAGTGQASADPNSGFRLRGTTPSDFQGTIIALQRTKFEIQMADSTASNPLGAGKIVMTAGTSTGELGGTYSQLQPRLAAGAQTYALANDVEISGAGYVNVNVLGGSDVIALFNSLKIGDGQIVAANKNDTTFRTVGFQNVKLLGGTSEFRAYDPAFGQAANANKAGSSIQLGTISETTPSSNITFKSTLPYYNSIVGPSTYTGITQIATGTLKLDVIGSISASSEIQVQAGAVFDVLAQSPTGYVIPAAQKLSGAGDWDGRIVLSGTLLPGTAGIGTMTGDDFTLNGNATLKFDLSTFDNTSDRLSLLGAFDKGSAGAYRFDFQGGGALGQTYSLVQFSSTTFVASNFSYVNLGPNLVGTFVATPTELQLVVVPEPTSAALVASGLISALGLRRGRRANRRAV